MAKLLTSIPLSTGSRIGLGTVTTTSTTYVETTDPAYVRIDPANFISGALFYFEAAIKTSAGTAYAALHDTAGSVVAGSEVTTTSTSEAIVRSAAITLSAATNYTVRLKVDNGANTNTYYASRVIVVENNSNIDKTETHILLNSAVVSTASAAYVDLSTIDFSFYQYTAANLNGTVSVFIDATFKTSAGTATVGLHDSSNSLVASSEITTTSATYVRVRSSAVTLVNATDYKARFKTSAGTLSLADVRLVIQQTSNPSATEKYIDIGSSTAAITASTQDLNGRFTFDPSDYTVTTSNWYHQMSANSNTASGAMTIRNFTDTSDLVNASITSTNTSAITRYRSSLAVTMPVASKSIIERVNPAAGTIYASNCFVLGILSWTNIDSLDDGGIFFIS